MPMVFCDLGQDAHITGGLLSDAVNEGVAKGYTEGYLRCSIVKDPLRRVNTNNNTPAVLHLRLVEGDRLTITVAPKGFGSENMASLTMLKPSVTREQARTLREGMTAEITNLWNQDVTLTLASISETGAGIPQSRKV